MSLARAGSVAMAQPCCEAAATKPATTPTKRVLPRTNPAAVRKARVAHSRAENEASAAQSNQGSTRHGATITPLRATVAGAGCEATAPARGRSQPATPGFAASCARPQTSWAVAAATRWPKALAVAMSPGTISSTEASEGVAVMSPA